ncbi:MAG: hypothetical protein JO151_21920 [Verrucomicrobia bacterium]|nr:hypothetical protein [Verrucomicrobiota bacterium]
MPALPIVTRVRIGQQTDSYRQHQYKQLFDHRKLHGHPSYLDEKDRRIIEAIFLSARLAFGFHPQ